MKKKLSLLITFVLAVGCVLSLFGCSNDTITLTQYNSPVDFHTDIQQMYLSDVFGSEFVPNEETDEVNGHTELSRPNPVTLSWRATNAAENYTVEISETADFAHKQVLNATQTSVEVYNLKIATTYYWRVSNGKVTSDVGTFVTSANGPRNLYVDGVTNFRDVGGWMTESGKRIKQGVLFRSARLNASYRTDEQGNEVKYEEPNQVVAEITAAGIDVVKQLGIKTEVDFRLDERNGYPQGVTPCSVVDGVDYVALPMSGSKTMLTDNEQQLKTLVEMLADESNYPLLYHCNIGTDRTGMVSYLVGALCGMNAHDLLIDYLFSNFGNIQDTKSPSNAHNSFFGLSDYQGDTLQQRAENFFLSIGVSQKTLDKVVDNLLEDVSVTTEDSEKIYLYRQNNVPYDDDNHCYEYCFVTPYIAANPTGGAVVVFPGGGYSHLSNATNKGGADNDGDQKESSAIAARYNAVGISVFVVNYRTTAVDSNVNYKQIVSDGVRAVKLVRANAERFGVDANKIAVQGYSAGGHLASVLLTTNDFVVDDQLYTPDEVDGISSQVNAGVLCYAVTTLQSGNTHSGTASVFAGDDDEILQKYSSVDNVTDLTAPCYLWCHQNDKTVKSANTTNFANALAQHGVAYTLDVFSDNGTNLHGLGVANEYADAAVWVSHAMQFLKTLGF